MKNLLNNKEHISIRRQSDIKYAADHAKNMSQQLGFKKTQCLSISVAASELANNILKYAKKGNIIIEPIQNSKTNGVKVIAKDYGPGISNISEALKDGFSTKGTLGLGLSGVNRLMDEFDFDESRKKGTKITVKKWL